MNTSQLECCIECDDLLRSNVIGVFASDRLPTTIKSYPCGLISNNQIYSRSGEHLLGIYIDKPGIVDFFDSYGHSVNYYGGPLEGWINRSAIRVTYNNKRLQGDMSTVCGLYCLHFLRQRLSGNSLSSIVNEFSDWNFEHNDEFIFDYMSAVYSDCTSNSCIYNQTCKSFVKYRG